MLIERLKCANKSPTILQYDPHPIIEVLHHLIVLAYSLRKEINDQCDEKIVEMSKFNNN